MRATVSEKRGEGKRSVKKSGPMRARGWGGAARERGGGKREGGQERGGTRELTRENK